MKAWLLSGWCGGDLVGSRGATSLRSLVDHFPGLCLHRLSFPLADPVKSELTVAEALYPLLIKRCSTASPRLTEGVFAPVGRWVGL